MKVFGRLISSSEGRRAIDDCNSPQRAPQLNRKEKTFNGAGKERREKILLFLKEIKASAHSACSAVRRFGFNRRGRRAERHCFYEELG